MPLERYIFILELKQSNFDIVYLSVLWIYCPFSLKHLLEHTKLDRNDAFRANLNALMLLSCDIESKR